MPAGGSRVRRLGRDIRRWELRQRKVDERVFRRLWQAYELLALREEVLPSRVRAPRFSGWQGGSLRSARVAGRPLARPLRLPHHHEGRWPARPGTPRIHWRRPKEKSSSTPPGLNTILNIVNASVPI